MSEITKLYENAGIEVPTVRLKVFKDDNGKIHTRPSFTAEKQIEITKFLISKYASFRKFRSYEQKDLYIVYYECRHFPRQYLPFEEALAESINYLWQDLTEEEKQQIKDILE